MTFLLFLRFLEVSFPWRIVLVPLTLFFIYLFVSSYSQVCWFSRVVLPELVSSWSPAKGSRSLSPFLWSQNSLEGRPWRLSVFVVFLFPLSSWIERPHTEHVRSASSSLSARFLFVNPPTFSFPKSIYLLRCGFFLLLSFFPVKPPIPKQRTVSQ